MADAQLPPRVVELDGPFSHVMVHTRGLRLHAATAGDPAEPLILLLHGAFGGWFEFKDVLAPLAAAGFHAAALDMRGYGMSDKPAFRGGDPMLLAVGDIKGAVHALGHSSTILAGVDAGGAVAWVATAESPELVRGLVSVSAAHPADLRGAIRSRPWDFLPLLARLSLHRLPLGETTRTRLYRRDLALNTTAAFHGSAAFREAADLRQRGAQITNAQPYIRSTSRLIVHSSPGGPVTAPTLLLHAPQSLWAPVVARQRRRVRPAATVTEGTVEGTKNLPHLENPLAFAETVAGFAAQLD